MRVVKFRPPSWAEPEPGEDTIEIEYTCETTKELHLPLTWRIRCSSFWRLRQAVTSAWASISCFFPTKK